MDSGRYLSPRSPALLPHLSHHLDGTNSTSYHSVYQAPQNCFSSVWAHILSGLEGVVCHIDDVLIFGANRSEHDQWLHAALSCLQEAGVTLNGDKCLFSQIQLLTFWEATGIETDHKTLIPLLSSKHLDDLPPRVLRFRLRLARFNYSITHVPGKLLYTADTLSHAPLPTTVHGSTLQQEVETIVNAVHLLPTNNADRDEHISPCPIEGCLKVMEFCRSGWPNRHSIPAAVKAYWKARISLSIHNNLLLFNSRVVVPPSLQENVLERIHEGHQGISRCQMLTKALVWWPGISSAVQEMIQQCQVCARDAEPTQKLLIPRPLPDYPWELSVRICLSCMENSIS